jgi:purine nucleoside permease
VSDELKNAASALGRKGGKAPSEAKRAAARTNIQQAQKNRWPKLKECNCDAATRTGWWAGKHRASCPVYRREAEAARLADKAQKDMETSE